jgi:hypothetical protein
VNKIFSNEKPMKIKKQKDVTRQQKPTPLIESSKVKKNVSFNWRQIKIEKQKEVTPQQELTPLIESSEVQYTLTNWKQIMMEKREVRQQVHTPLTHESKTKKAIWQINTKKQRKAARQQLDQICDTTGFEDNMEATREFEKIIGCPNNSYVTYWR